MILRIKRLWQKGIMKRASKSEPRPYWQYTGLDQLDQLIPVGFTREHVVTKEIIDNACDAAENAGGKVVISLGGSRLRVSNTGKITKKEIEKISDFSKSITEKYSRRAYIRGQIGHGLKIAIMMAISEEHQVYICSAGYHHTIHLIDRLALKPNRVLSVSSEEFTYADTVTIDVPLLRHRGKVMEYIDRYIALNPHISFEFNSKLYSNVSDLKKSNKVDISSYNSEEFDRFAKSYFATGFSLEDFIDLFSVKKTKLEQLVRECSHDRGKLYNLIRNNVFKTTPPVIGEKAIAARIKEVKNCDLLPETYRKLNVDKGFIEIAFLDDSGTFVIAGVNGSCLPEESIWIKKAVKRREKGKKITESFDVTLNHVKGDLKLKRPLFFSYCSTVPKFKDSNKQTVIIQREKVYNALKNLQKKISPKMSSSKDWLIAEDKYKQIVADNPIVKVEAKKIKVHPTTYCFIRECKKMAGDLREKYGPITLRQLYYQCVSKGLITNAANSYDNLINHMGTAREEGFIEYDIFEDRSRYTKEPQTESVKEEPEDYIRKRLIKSLDMPDIDVWENQAYYVELWIEKDALFSLFAPIAEEKQIALFPSRGYTSLTKIQEAKDRFREKMGNNKKGIILYAGDLDPSGTDIFQNIQNKFGKEKNIEIERFALKAEHTKDLIAMPIKETDSRYKTFIEQHPEIKGAYELDAMDPDVLQNLTVSWIEKYFKEHMVPRNEIANWRKDFKHTKKLLFQKIGLD